MELNGKIVAITGGGRGIGQAVAVGLAKKGAKIAILDLDQDALAKTKALVEAEGSEARGYQCNVADEEQVESTFSRIVADFGSIEGLVNNAGILRDAQLIKVKEGKVVKKMSADHFELVVDVHMKGAFLCAREAAAHMVELSVKEGCIAHSQPHIEVHFKLFPFMPKRGFQRIGDHYSVVRRECWIANTPLILKSF